MSCMCEMILDDCVCNLYAVKCLVGPHLSSPHPGTRFRNEGFLSLLLKLSSPANVRRYLPWLRALSRAPERAVRPYPGFEDSLPSGFQSPRDLGQFRRDQLVDQEHTRRIWHHPQHVRRQATVQARDTLFPHDELERLHQACVLDDTAHGRLSQSRPDDFVRVSDERRDGLGSPRRADD